jgi:acylphosphatase
MASVENQRDSVPLVLIGEAQHLQRTRRLQPVPDGEWDVLTAHTHHPDVLANLARRAAEYSRYHYAEILYRNAAAAGNRDALRSLADWYSERDRPAARVEQAYRDAAAAGDPRALSRLTHWLDEQNRPAAEVEQYYRDAAAAGDPTALSRLTHWLDEQDRPAAEVEQYYRDAAAAGDRGALTSLADWLDMQNRPAAEVEQAYRDAAATGKRSSLSGLAAAWLSKQHRPAGEPDGGVVMAELGTTEDGGTAQTGIMGGVPCVAGTRIPVDRRPVRCRDGGFEPPSLDPTFT